MTEAIIRKYFVELVKSLPMNDAKFRAELYSADLLPGNLWDEVQSKPTEADKAEHFLRNGIKNDTDSLNKLLTIMKQYDGHLRKLAETIYGESDLQHPKKRKIDTVSMLGEVQNKLKTAYKCICNSDNPHSYLQLALVRDEICNIRDHGRLNEITRHTLQGQVDEILKIKEPLKRGLEDIFHYNDSPCPKLTIILGAPGIGKTTLANEICLKWANDKDCFLSNDYDLIILIRLRVIQERTLQQMMIEAVGSETAYDELLTKSHGERCLIILEGLDEISAHWQQNDTMFCHLVKNTVVLSHANILVTSRPHACIDLYNDIKGYARKIEIVGFDKPQVKERAELYFQNSITAEKFMDQVSNDPHISSLCYVPLCLNMVLDCFKYNNETLHTTLTELYQSFIISKVHDHIRFKKAVPLGTVLECDEQCLRNLATLLSDGPNSLPKTALEMIFLLSKLAYRSYFEWYEAKESYRKMNPKIIYTNQDLAQCNITNSESDACGLLKATNTLFATSNTAVYSFNHLSVQEYFCALYISLLPEDQQLQLLKDHITHYPHMWPFYAGITNLISHDVLHYLCQFLLWDGQSQEINLFDKPCIIVNDIDNCKTTVSLNSIYEAQVSSDVCQQGKLFSVSITGRTLFPYDCVRISYFMSIAPVTHLLLQFCTVTDQEAEMLTRYNCLPSLKVLDLFGNDITRKGMESVAKIIKNSTNLTDLLFASNPIGDDGIKLLSLSNLKHLVQLNVCQTKMTKVSAYDLGECFKCNNSLQSLEISDNDIKDSGLIGILDNLPSTLVWLNVSDCNLTCNGAVIIGKVLRKNQTLKHLGISKNSIGDDGISAVSDGLHVNTTLIQLVAQKCEFYTKGVESITKMLLVNKTLKYLDISGNHFDENGMTAVTRSIYTNTTLVQLQAFNHKGAAGMAQMLTVNKTLKQLGISCSDDTAAVLKMFCEGNCELMQLSIAYTMQLSIAYIMNERDENFMAIKDYVDAVNRATTAVYITCDRHACHTLDGVLQEQCVLKKNYQSARKDTIDSDLGNTSIEEWSTNDDRTWPSGPCQASYSVSIT